MDKLPVDMNWKMFMNFVVSKYKWFGITIDDYFSNLKQEDISMTTRRIDHLMSDMKIEDDKITLNIQKEDPFLDGIEMYVTTLNSTIRMKYDCFFVLNKVDYV